MPGTMKSYGTTKKVSSHNKKKKMKKSKNIVGKRVKKRTTGSMYG